MPPQQPTTSDPYAQDQITQVPADRREGMLGLLGGHGKSASIDDMVKQHHDARLTNAQMYANASKTAVGNYLHAQQGIDPRTNQRFDDPDYKGTNPITGQPFANAQEAKDALQQYYNNQHEEAWGNYTKIAGVNPEAKGALGKAQAILQHIMGQGAVQGVPPQQPQRGGQMAAPPAPSTPNYPTTVGEAGVTQTAPQARGMAPPPQPAGPSFLAQAPFLRAQEEFTRGLGHRSAEMVSDVNTRDALVKKVIPQSDWDKPYVQDYKLTGTISRGMLSQLKMQKGPLVRDKNGLPVRTLLNPSQDPEVGGLYNPDTLERMDGYTPMSESDLKTNTINLMTPDGPREMFRVGNKVYDNHGVLQDGELVPFSRGMVKTITDREVKGYDAGGNPTSYLLRSTRTPDMPGGIPSPVASPPAGPVAPAVGTSSPAAQGKGGGAGAAPKAKGGGTSKFASGGAVFPAGQFNQFTKGAVGVDQARSSLLGNNYEKGEVGGLASDLDVFKSPGSIKKIGEYLQLVNNQVANQADAIAQHGPIAAAEWYVGLPQAVIGLQQGALREESEKLNPAEQKFVADYFRTMGTMGGMRASTGMPAYEWSFRNMFAEMPTPGPVTDYNEAVRRLMNYVGETNVPAKHNALMEKVDVNEFENKIRGRKGGTTPPPTPGGPPKTADELLSKYGIKKTK